MHEKRFKLFEIFFICLLSLFLQTEMCGMVRGGWFSTYLSVSPSMQSVSNKGIAGLIGRNKMYNKNDGAVYQVCLH